MIRVPRFSARLLVIASIVVLVIAGLFGGVLYWLNVQQARATTAYAEALVRAQAGRTAQATPEARAAAARAIEAVLQRYPTAGMAGQAAYELAGLRYTDRQYAAARSAYEIAAGRSPGTTLQTVSRVGIAYTWEAERNYPKAIESFQALLAEARPSDFLYEDLLIDLAVAQELAGRRDDAVQSYRRILKDVPKTRRAEDIRARLASLGATLDGAR
jgi:tetratricopeptide (TPR) repeat protein